MLKSKSIIAEQLLEAEETRELLKEMIIEKDDRLQEVMVLRAQYLASDEFLYLSKEFRPFFLDKVFDHCREGQEIPIIERNLRNMCWALSKQEPQLSPGVSKEWERAYEYATQQVSIADVASYFLSIETFRRNIPCPFHEDKSPSFKIYEKSNRFVCFGCGVRGSPIDFVMKYQNCSFKEAVQIISNNSL